jgi:DNA-binding response OmpR family regulator
MTGLCPHCGYDLIQDEPIERPEISMQPYGDCRFHGHTVDLTRAERAILWALLKADGKPVPKTILNERCGYEGDNNVAEVLLHRIRKKMRAAHPIVPIKTIWGVGVRWAA